VGEPRGREQGEGGTAHPNFQAEFQAEFQGLAPVAYRLAPGAVQ
jgi:hypothetical protein